jgi:hypothetical protein
LQHEHPPPGAVFLGAHVGLEDVADITDDLARGLAAMRG